MEENKDRKLWLIVPTHDNSGLIQSDRQKVTSLVMMERPREWSSFHTSTNFGSLLQ